MRCVVQRADRQLVGVVGPDREAAVLLVELEVELPGLQHGAVLVAEKRHQQLVAQVAAVRVPVDVEPAGIGRIRAPFQHVEPQRIVGAADAHVVRHEIQHLPEPVLRERRHHRLESRLIAQLRIERVMIDDVVAVGAARPRLQIGRGIDMADAEPGQIGRQLRGVGRSRNPCGTAGGRWRAEWRAACLCLSSDWAWSRFARMPR